MALMFARLARNFAKAGYFPTDTATLSRTLQALAPCESGQVRLLDPCAGEGIAIAEAAHHLGRERCECFAVEYQRERAEHARGLVDSCLRSDLMDCMISRQSFGLLWLNPPYGDLSKDESAASWSISAPGRERLEKRFYQRAVPLLQYGGVLVFIIPHYVLDAELCGWLTNQFSDLRVFEAPEKRFQQVVLLGIRSRSQERASSAAEVKALRQHLLAIGSGESKADELPEDWTLAPYVVPTANKPLEHFYRISLEPEQLAAEIARLKGLWPQFTQHFAQKTLPARQPARQMSDWHLALSLAAGAMSGVVRSSKSGRTLIVKGHTYKDKLCRTEVTMDEDGVVTETRIHTDRFVPVIKAWDITEGSPTFGRILTISSGAQEEPELVQAEADSRAAATVQAAQSLEAEAQPIAPSY